MNLKSNNKMGMIEQLKEDFEEFGKSCRGILLFGSFAGEEQTRRSDIDVCIVMPSGGILDEVYGKLGGKYDIKVFENLPLYIKMEVIRHHKVICGDELDLSEYFYFFRKLWQDMEHRIAGNEFKNFAERKGNRRVWMNENEKILREIGSV